VIVLLISASASLGQGKTGSSVEETQGEAAGAPSIRFTELRFEAGTVNEGTVLNHDFEFVNEGTGVLKIKNIVPA
jgi:hypothetical protein